MNIGGSILPSSCPEILVKIPFKTGIHQDGVCLQVIPNETRDTHVLVFQTATESHVLASHPNGYSCHSLAKSMADRDSEKALRQSLYIIACGGKLSALCASILLGITSKK